MSKQTKFKPPCGECPFKKTSMRGWLGAACNNPVEFLMSAFGEAGHPCHMDNEEQCTGAIVSANMSCKKFRPGPLADMQSMAPKKHSNILTAPEFIAHHTLRKSDD